MENTLKHYLTQAKTNVLIQKAEKKINKIQHNKIRENRTELRGCVVINKQKTVSRTDPQKYTVNVFLVF